MPTNTPPAKTGPRREIGALWLRNNEKGPYYTGKLNLADLQGKSEVKIIVWNNNDKKNDMAPDLRILLEINEYETLAGIPSTRPTSASPAFVTPPRPATVVKKAVPRKPVVEEEELM
jgi:hypothetical protein